MKKEFIIIKTTYPTVSKAKELADILLKEKLAACVQLAQIESLYSWHEKIENETEILVTIKTMAFNYDKIEKVIKKHHEYYIPQIVAIPIEQGYKPYLDWISSNVKNV